MIYKKYMALIMVLGLMSFEPAFAMQIGSENELYSNNYSSNIFEKINKTKTSNGIVNCKIEGNNVSGRNEGFFNMSSEKIKSFKKFSKKDHSIQFLPKFKHSPIKTNLTVHAITKNKSESYKAQISDLKLKQPQISSDKNIETIKSESNINKTHNLNTNFNTNKNKKENDEFSLNNHSINQNLTEISNFTDIPNDTPEINNITNGTLNSTENNSISNNSPNLISTESSKCEESTKDKVCDTLLAVGYLSASIAAGCALNPDPLASKVIGAIAVGVAVVSFVAYICVKWFW